MNYFLSSCIIIAAFIPVSYANGDPTEAHDGIFRTLKLNEDEMNYVSSLHASADFHTLHEFVAEKLQNADLTNNERFQVKNFLRDRRPPPVIATFLSDADRQQIRHFHRLGDLDSIFAIIGQRLFELDPVRREEAITYIWPNQNEDAMQYFKLQD